MNGSDQITQTVLALIGVLALIVVLAWVARRFVNVPGRAGQRFNVLGTMTIGPRERVLLVEVGDQQLLLGVSPGQIRSLQTLERPISLTQVESTMTPAAGRAGPFADLLRRAQGSRRESVDS